MLPLGMASDSVFRACPLPRHAGLNRNRGLNNYRMQTPVGIYRGAVVHPGGIETGILADGMIEVRQERPHARADILDLRFE